MNSQNVTLKLPADLVKRAKVLAAEQRVSLSALLTAKLEDTIGETAAYAAAHKRALKYLESGWALEGGQPGRDPRP